MFMHAGRNIVRIVLYFCNLFLFLDYRDDIIIIIIMVLSCFSKHFDVLTYPVVKYIVSSSYKIKCNAIGTSI